MDMLSGFLRHLHELRRRVIWISVTFGIFFVICVVFEIRWTTISGVEVPYPYPNVFNAVAIQFFNILLASLKPPQVVPAVLGPLEGVMVEMKIALFLSFTLSMPMIVYQLGRFIAPALKPREKSLLLKISVPSALLFVAGAMFAYLLILPFVFEFLYAIGISMIRDPTTGVAVAYLSPDQFIDFTLMFLIAFGLAFELPIIMVGITGVGLVKPDFWKRNWRYATAAIFVFGAVITPDGSGATMLLVALPMLALYVVGYFVSKRIYAKRME